MRLAIVDIQFASRFYAAQLALPTTTRACASGLPWALGWLVLTILPAISHAAPPNFPRTQATKENEISRVESWFAERSLTEINSALARLRPKPVNESDKALLMRDLPLLNAHNRIGDEREMRALHERLEKTLKFFERTQVVELIVFRHSQPIVYNKPGVVVVISTEVLNIVGDETAALVGIVAHELTHESFSLEFLHATESGNMPKLRELELFCDAVAVVVMLELGFDPARYAQVLKRIANHSQASAQLNNGQNSHPALETRLRLIANISTLIARH